MTRALVITFALVGIALCGLYVRDVAKGSLAVDPLVEAAAKRMIEDARK